MARVTQQAIREAEILADGGMDGVVVENFRDNPFYPGPVPSETVAAMTVVAGAIIDRVGVPVGINVLRNDADSALGIAAAVGAAFIRVNIHTGTMFTDQGLIQGRAHETLRKRAALSLNTAILADVLVKHATPPAGTDLETAAKDCWFRGRADGIILTGRATGGPVDGQELRQLKRALPPEARVWVGSGTTAETAAGYLETADGLIVGSALQTGGMAGGGVQRDRVKVFMDALGRS